MADDNVTIELKIDDAEFKSKLDGIGVSLKNFSSSGEGSFSKFGAKMLEANAALELIHKGFELIKGSAEKVVRVFDDATRAAINEERSLFRMNEALSAQGLYSRSASEEMEKFARSIQSSTTMSADHVVGLEAAALKYARTTEQAKALVRASVDLSIATGTSAESAITRLGMSLNGYGSHLNRIAPAVQNLTKRQLEQGAAIDIVARQYSGSAANAATTFDGRLTKMKVSYDNLLSSTGKLITQSPMMNKFLEAIRVGFEKATDLINNFAKSGQFEALLKNLFKIGQSVITYVVAPIELGINTIKGVFQSLVYLGDGVVYDFAKVGQAITYALLEVPAKALSGIAGFVGRFNSSLGDAISSASSKMSSVYGSIQTFAESSGEVLVDQGEKVKETWSSIFDFSASDKMSKSLGEFETYINSMNIKMGQHKEQVKEAEEKITDMMLKAGSIVSQHLTKMISGGMQMIGASLVQGKKAFADFGKMILGTIGDMSIAIGENLIAQGLGINALKMALLSLDGAAAIAAGAALVVLGGALKAMAGTGGMGQFGGEAGGGGGGGAAPAPAESSQMEKKHASIIVNGDFLNSRETANHLAEIVRQNSDITDYSITAQGRAWA